MTEALPVEQKMSLPDIVMIFIGESGSGKSTCINYFANYFMRSNFTETHKYSRMKVVIPNRIIKQVNLHVADKSHSEANIENSAQSQTRECITYRFQWNNRSIHVVDTPGFNDTDLNKDNENMKKILTKMSELPFVTAIVVTINGTIPRLQTGLKSALAQLRSSLPDAVFDNLLFIFTNCNEETQSFPAMLLSDFHPSAEHMFTMQNSLFSLQDLSVLENPKALGRIVQTWLDSVEVMEKMMDTVCCLTATSVAMFEQMRNKRESLISDMEMLILKQKSLINIVKNLEIEKNRLENANSDKTANQQFTETKMIDVIVIEAKTYYSTLCGHHGDVAVCHENCSLTFSQQLNFDHFKHCAAADGNNCRHCKCGMNRHFHSYQIPVTKKTNIEQIIQAKHTAYIKASCEADNIDNHIKQLNYTCQQFKIEINTIRNQILTTMNDLKTICTHFNFVEEMSSIIQKLRMEAKSANDLLAKQQFEATANAIEQLITQLN